MTAPVATPVPGNGVRIGLLVGAILVHLIGLGMSLFGIIAWAFGAPVDPLAILLVSAVAGVVLLVVLILGFVLSRRGRWVVALTTLIIEIAGWVVANILIVDIGLNP